MNGFTVRPLVLFGNLQRILWAMLAIAFATFQTRPAPEDAPRVSGHRRDRLHQDGRAEYHNVTSSGSPVKLVSTR